MNDQYWKWKFKAAELILVTSIDDEAQIGVS